MIVQLIGGAPRVIPHEGKIAVFDKVDGEDHGFLFKPDVAIAVATRLLGAVAGIAGRDRYSQPVQAIELGGGGTDDTGERFAKLIFTINGTPLTVDLSATQVAELAAGFATAARLIDAPEHPRRDG